MTRLGTLGLRSALVFAALVSASARSATTAELFLLAHLAAPSPIAGCCRGSGIEPGPQVIVRLSQLMESLPAIEFAGSSSGAWSTFSVGPYYYLLGSAPETDPSSGQGLQVVRVNDWALTGSWGLGMAIHSTRTIDFDLPVLVVASLAYLRMHARYFLSDRWSLTASSEASLAVAVRYFSVAPSLSLGVGYRF